MWTNCYMNIQSERHGYTSHGRQNRVKCSDIITRHENNIFNKTKQHYEQRESKHNSQDYHTNT